MNTANALTRQGIAERLEEFVRMAGEVTRDDPDFGRDVHLFETGYVDSLGVIRLISHLESAYSLKLTDEELFDPAFTTINGISGILAARLGCATSGSGTRPGADPDLE